MIELDVDMGYLDDDELMCVILHDECGEHEPIEYIRKVEYDEMREATARRKDMCCKLQDENASLKELLGIVWMAGDYTAFQQRDELKRRMRELGVEVDE